MSDKPDHESALSLSDGHDPSGPWPYERCKSERCRGRRVTCGFQVSDDDWAAVTDDEAAIPHGHVLCLSCFDELAQAKGVRYQLLSVAPVTWTGDTTAARPLPEEGDEEAAVAYINDCIDDEIFGGCIESGHVKAAFLDGAAHGRRQGEAVARNVCRIAGVAYEAAAHLATGPLPLSEAQRGWAQLIAGRAPPSPREPDPTPGRSAQTSGNAGEGEASRAPIRSAPRPDPGGEPSPAEPTYPLPDGWHWEDVYATGPARSGGRSPQVYEYEGCLELDEDCRGSAPVPVILAVLARAGLLPSGLTPDQRRDLVRGHPLHRAAVDGWNTASRERDRLRKLLREIVSATVAWCDELPDSATVEAGAFKRLGDLLVKARDLTALGEPVEPTDG